MNNFLTTIGVACCILLANIGFTQKPYDVRLIPDSMLKNADVVKRLDETVIKLKGLDRLVSYNKVVYTILNEKGDRYGYISETYDKMREINTFDATLFSPAGEKIRSVKRSEVKDESAVSGISLMEDDRIKWFNFFNRSYPYTVEFVIETESRNTMFFPTWSPIGNEHMGVMQSSLQVFVPKDYQLRFKALGGAADARRTEEGNESVFSWEIKNQVPLLKEPYSVSWYDLTPTVLLAPSKFTVQGYAGDMNSWETYGKFNLQLNSGRDVLPSNIKADVQRIIAPLSSDKEKICALYKYLQENTRYISVQIGIGGWQPFEASYVASKKYGDCKALSNYMTALLKEAGIESYYAIIKAGDEPNKRWFQPEFTSSNFNHIIVCAPNKGDTIWLECTDQKQYPGYMSDFTDDRYAFLITPSGGKLVKTPKYKVADNLQVRHINAIVGAEGNVKINTTTIYRAQEQDGYYNLVTALSKDKVNEVLKTYLDLPNYELVSYDYKPHLEQLPVMDEKLEIEGLHYAQVSGKRLFIVPNIMNRTGLKPLLDTTRKYPLRLYKEYRNIDSATITVPEGYSAESLPKDVEIKSPFGFYKAITRFENNSITYTRIIERYSGTFPAAAYNDFVKFCEQVYRADRTKVVLVKAAD